MEIHVSGDNSVVMEFNSDSEDDDDNILRDLMSHHGHHQNTSNRNGAQEKKHVHVHLDEQAPVSGKSMKQSGSDHGSIFSESDEDFCLVDAPTITKVVSVYTVNKQVKNSRNGLCECSLRISSNLLASTLSIHVRFYSHSF